MVVYTRGAIRFSNGMFVSFHTFKATAQLKIVSELINIDTMYHIGGTLRGI